MLVVGQEAFGEAGGALVSARVFQANFVERFSNRLRGPNLDVFARKALDCLHQFLFALHDDLFAALGAVEVHANTAKRHLYKAGQEPRFEVPNFFYTFLLQHRLEEVPKLQGQRGVTLGILADELGGEFPHF